MLLGEDNMTLRFVKRLGLVAMLLVAQLA